MAWATIDQVEEWLGLSSDERMVDCLAISESWCQRQRPDLDADTTPKADVQHAVVLYAALLYRERATPQGLAAYDGLEGGSFADNSAMLNIYRLLGSRKPVAR